MLCLQTFKLNWHGYICIYRVNQGRIEHPRSEEHTSELQSLTNLVCRLLLEKKKKKIKKITESEN